jgi:hypothetical protein
MSMAYNPWSSSGMTIYTSLPNASMYPAQEQATGSTVQKTTPRLNSVI